MALTARQGAPAKLPHVIDPGNIDEYSLESAACALDELIPLSLRNVGRFARRRPARYGSVIVTPCRNA